MSLLYWGKTKKVHTNPDYAGFDGGPVGGYVPNMSDEDNMRWKAKETGSTRGFPQVEIRKLIGEAQVTIIVNLGMGYVYKSGDPHGVSNDYATPTEGINVHMSMNGAIKATFTEFAEISAAVDEAKAYLLDKYGPIDPNLRFVTKDHIVGDEVQFVTYHYHPVRENVERKGTVVSAGPWGTLKGLGHDLEESYHGLDTTRVLIIESDGKLYAESCARLVKPITGLMPPVYAPKTKK